MSDQPDQKAEQATSKRGDAAWKEARDKVAERNDQARKEGKERRQAYEHQKADARRAAERIQMEQMSDRSGRG
jgi:hypothetical protein